LFIHSVDGENILGQIDANEDNVLGLSAPPAGQFSAGVNILGLPFGQC